MPTELLTALGLVLGLGSLGTVIRQIARRRTSRRCTTAAEAEKTGMWDVLRSWVEGKAQIALERERRSTRVATLRQINSLPPGASITEVSGPGTSVVIRVPASYRCHEAGQPQGAAHD